MNRDQGCRADGPSDRHVSSDPSERLLNDAAIYSVGVSSGSQSSETTQAGLSRLGFPVVEINSSQSAG